jgi:ABC-type nitrate/sulfonate/bicarbonate transport system ATPase subunit
MASLTGAGAPRLSFEGVGLERFVFHGEFAPGLYAVLGGPSDGPGELLKMAAGQLKPARGRVRLDSEEIFSSPQQRRAVAATTLPYVPAAPSVRSAIELVAAARGHEPQTVFEILETLKQSALLQQLPHRLSVSEVAAVALALALGHSSARVFALWQPLAVPGVEESWLAANLAARAEASVVLVASKSVGAALFSATRIHFRQGSVFEPQHSVGSLAARTLLLRAEPIERLAEQLLGLPGTLGGEIVRGQPGLLRIHLSKESPDAAERVSLLALQVAAAEGIRVDALKLEGGTPP